MRRQPALGQVDAPAIEEFAAGRDRDEHRRVTVLGDADGRGHFSPHCDSPRRGETSRGALRGPPAPGGVHPRRRSPLHAAGDCAPISRCGPGTFVADRCAMQTIPSEVADFVGRGERRRDIPVRFRSLGRVLLAGLPLLATAGALPGCTAGPDSGPEVVQPAGEPTGSSGRRRRGERRSLPGSAAGRVGPGAAD